jgi:YfiH family protein
MITLGRLNDLDGVRHGFMTRLGGVSEGLYASLNCGYGSGDDPERVTENRHRALSQAELQGLPLVTCYQVHSAKAVHVTTAWKREEAPQVDAMVTDRPGIALGILTADCAPVLMADPQARIVGAAHAGWRGAIGGVVEATLDLMVKLGAKVDHVVAGIGPCIAQRSYEVGPEFPAPFLAQNPQNEDYFAPSRRAGHYLFDLPSYVASRLGAAGVKRVNLAYCDTCAEADRFFSYRRTTLEGRKDYGRLLSLICLEP